MNFQKQTKLNKNDFFFYDGKLVSENKAKHDPPLKLDIEMKWPDRARNWTSYYISNFGN